MNALTDDMLPPFASAERTFERRFMAMIERRKFTRDAITGGVAILRSDALRILRPVPWRLIPYSTCERRRVVKLGTLMMLAICLDETGATPECMTQEQILVAWTAAGKDAWLRSVVVREYHHRAVLRSMIHDGTMIDSITAALAEYRA